MLSIFCRWMMPNLETATKDDTDPSRSERSGRMFCLRYFERTCEESKGILGRFASVQNAHSTGALDSASKSKLLSVLHRNLESPVDLPFPS